MSAKQRKPLLETETGKAASQAAINKAMFERFNAETQNFAPDVDVSLTPPAENQALSPAMPEVNVAIVAESKSSEESVRFCVDLPLSLHKKFSRAALDAGTKKTVLIRTWIENFVSG